QVALTHQPASLTDSGFEAFAPTANGFQYDPAGPVWTFGGAAGVSWAGTAFTAGNPAPPQGSQVAFLQGLGSVSQSATFAAGDYTLSLAAAQRGNFASAQTLRVLVDGNGVATFTNITGTG